VAAGLPRTHARRAAVQALYQSIVNGQSLEKESLDFIAAENSEKNG
jgi:N utilization substance protein B